MFNRFAGVGPDSTRSSGAIPGMLDENMGALSAVDTSSSCEDIKVCFTKTVRIKPLTSAQEGQ